MSGLEQLNVAGKDYYRSLYQAELELEVEWLGRSAKDKVDSIELLLERNRLVPARLVELGSGPGAVIRECQRRKLGSHHLAIDYSPEAIDYLKEHSSGIQAMQADITGAGFALNGTFDVIVLSHVLEHLEDPVGFLQAIHKAVSFRHAIFEVPLEDLPASRLKGIFRDRRTNKAGHVQFFTGETFERLLIGNGFKIIDRRTYVPILDKDTLRFLAQKDHSRAKHLYLMKSLAGRALSRFFEPFWAKYYYAHHAVLCVANR